MLPVSIVWKVMLGAALLGAAAGFVGTFAVLRRRALLGDMLSHAALPGIALVFLVWQTRELLPLSLGALAAGLLGVGVVATIARWTRTTEDAALGIVLSTFFGAGVVLLTMLQSTEEGNKAGLDSFLFGEIASLRSQDIQTILVVAALLLTVVLALYKELKLLTFDTGFAAAQGWPTFALDLTVMVAVAVVTVIGLPICGVILMAAMLIGPAASARFWTNRLGSMLAIASVFGALSGALGCALAAPVLMQSLGLGWIVGGARTSLPPGPMIVLAGALLLFVSMLIAPERGLVARWRTRSRLRQQVARDHLLRAVYELSPSPESQRPWVGLERLGEHGGWQAGGLEAEIRASERGGFVERSKNRLRFTPAGYEHAADLVRAHRLWEMYMVGDWNRAPERVHQDADMLEHLLTPEMVTRLEAMLEAQGRLPEGSYGSVPRSLHPYQHDTSEAR